MESQHADKTPHLRPVRLEGEGGSAALTVIPPLTQKPTGSDLLGRNPVSDAYYKNPVNLPPLGRAQVGKGVGKALGVSGQDPSKMGNHCLSNQAPQLKTVKRVGAGASRREGIPFNQQPSPKPVGIHSQTTATKAPPAVAAVIDQPPCTLR